MIRRRKNLYVPAHPFYDLAVNDSNQAPGTRALLSQYCRSKRELLSNSGNLIACHTYDHPLITKIKSGPEWTKQIDIPKLQLEKITGHQVDFFAYPYGVWNEY